MKAVKFIFINILSGCFFIFLSGISNINNTEAIQSVESLKEIINDSNISCDSISNWILVCNGELDRDELATCLVEYGKKLYNDACFYKADSIFNIALNNLIDDDLQKLASIYFWKGKVASKIDKSESVLDFFNSAANYYKRLENCKGIVFSYLESGIFFSKQKNYTVAYMQFDNALSFALAENNQLFINLCYLNYGHCKLEQFKYNEALKYYNKVDVEKAISKKSLAILYNNLSHIYIKKNNYKIAEHYLIQSIKIKESLGDVYGVFHSKLNLINFYIKSGKIQKAELIGKEIGELKVKLSNDQKLDSIYTFAELRLKTGHTNDGIKLLNRFYQLKDSLSNITFSDKLIDMQKSFELKEKDQEIALLHKEDALNQARLKTKNVLIAVIGSFLLILILVGYLINRQRKELAQSRRRLLRQKEDITGMNEQLRVSNLAKDRILSVIGHDLRGPVGGLKELIELYMELPEYEPNDIKNLLKAARESSTSTYHLLENLLSWANSQRGDIVFNPVATPLAPLIKQSVQLLDRSINVRNVRFEYDIPKALVIQVDMNMLRTIIRNLVSNALKYSPDNGLIKIMVIEDGKQVKFCICDEGKGMTADETKSIFKKKETYFIGSELTAKGTGLGLILCKEFVERHGGVIWINSKEGVGTQVWFSIPQKGVSTTKVNELQSSAAQ
ncbi:tetratricopeptide repeat-containing sensor histidine kinase [Carboxylicivirga sediminis]|uniref:histidine kinase n=1 Tax=Carboxylicivirga sediminis TaxID=2006564 RepID=A0A941F626_9BACT|nr:tetratricopeptide repeat-containing sensor histidine kinase [Carboxylicivirga sediminis]MBR8536335.1 tetratricopeptide repeat-containing sensor histidine kinase [Carboxylicivirga sediminis]